MRIKLDENLPISLVEALVQLGHEADSVQQEGLQGSPDPDVWAAAQAAKRFLVTQDLDFSDVRQFAPGTHYGLLLVRLANPSRRALKSYIESLFRAEDVERWARCFVVAMDLLSLRGILKPRVRGVTVEEMNETIRRVGGSGA